MNLESNEISVIADEYVLGLLEDGDRAYVEAEIELNAALKQAVAEAYERFLPLDTGLAPTDVSPSLWNAISSRLTEQQRTSLAMRQIPPRRSTTIIAPVGERPPYRRSLPRSFWL